MRQQGKKQQILAITHLPQVAASGNQQLFVFKNNEADISETQIRTLDDEGRIQAIAEMLSGRTPSEAAKLNAKHLLEIQSAWFLWLQLVSFVIHIDIGGFRLCRGGRQHITSLIFFDARMSFHPIKLGFMNFVLA